MQSIKLDFLLGEDLFCPMCGAKIIDKDESVNTSKLCKHTMLIATNLGLEYLDDHTIDENYDRVDLEDYLDELNNQIAFMFTISEPTPSEFGMYVGFKK